MADLATLRSTHEAGFAGAVWREVVVVHVPLAADRIDAIDHLVHASGAQRGHVENLCVATLEQTRTVAGRNNADFGLELTEIGWATAIHADAFVQDTVADDLLG